MLAIMEFSDHTTNDLESLFSPQSIAVVGASADTTNPGSRYVKQLLEFGFNGKVYAVNPKGGEISGLKIYTSLAAVPGPVDYVISTIPADLVPQLIQDCADKGVKLLQLFTARLGETGIPERKQLEERIASLARRAGVRLVGPNCRGLYRPDKGLTFRFTSPKAKGDVAFISQSASHAAELMNRAEFRGLAFSQIVSYGNAVDINETELLDYYAKDPNTRIILAYIEGVRSPDFPKVLKAATRRKPVIVFKVGRTAAGARAASSHTGSLAGSYTIWQSLMQQCGAISVTSLEELVDTAIAFSKLPAPEGRNIGAAGAGGGGSILSADEFELQGLHMPPLPEEVLDELKTFLGDAWMMIKNPVDTSVVPPAVWGVEKVRRILTAVAKNPLYQILVCDSGEWFPDSAADVSKYQDIVSLFLEVKKDIKKPVAIVMRPADHAEEWRWRGLMEQQQCCVQAGAAVFPSVGRAARALSKFVDYHLPPRV